MCEFAGELTQASLIYRFSPLGVQCVNLPGDSHKCLSCPAGFADQDGGCVDVDECSEYKPCSLKPLVSCLNTVSLLINI